MSIADEKCVSLVTFRRSGDGVPSPVWINQLSDGRVGFWTSSGSGKAKRLRNNPRVTLQACSMSGKVKDGSPVLSGTPEMVASGPLFDEVKRKGREKYGFQVTLSRLMGSIPMKRKGLTYGDAVVLIRLDE
ncbi:PPOX class F420-dependent oxidoreductase [Nocardioides sp.]|uniref:PPOX class F420-dependent oxidoreductase n=1 Tax=Nocardioides sp. TaxID=35761 RepID=UPI002603FA0F|nr:PPOX class F420-dependent oxidoreductase [Nocardioides sp.]